MVTLDILTVPSLANAIQFVVSVCCGFRKHTLVHTACMRESGYLCVGIYRGAFLESRIHLFVYERNGVCLYEFMDMCAFPKRVKGSFKNSMC